MTIKYNARDLLHLPLEQLWRLPSGPCILVLDDGEAETSIHRVIFCYYCWWPHREFKNVPLTKDHQIWMETPTKNTAHRLMERAIDAALISHGTIDPEYLALRIKEEVGRIYNDFTTGCEAYVTSIDALDFVDILEHPEISAINRKIQSYDLNNKGVLASMERYIEESQIATRKTLMDPTFLPGNRLAETIRAGIVDINQVSQCVNLRGNPTDIDSHLFRRPILFGFADGITGLEDSAKESRSAAKALFFTKEPLSDVEYFNRQLQLVASVLPNLHAGDDCGSTRYIPWAVRSNNISAIDGAWYCETPGEPLKVVRAADKSLVGKTLLLRNPLTCQHPDIYGICGRCFGELRRSIPRGTNIGHCSTVVLCEKVSQNVLSTKHLDGTAVVSEFRLTTQDAQFIRVLPSQFELGISTALTGQRVKLCVRKDAMSNIADINLVSDITTLALNRITQMEDVLFVVEDEDGDVERTPVIVSMGSRLASFSHPFLTYIKQYGYTLIEGKNKSEGTFFEIDLTDWNRDLPVWVLPRKHANTKEYMEAIERIVKSSGKGKAKDKVSYDLSDTGVLANVLIEFHDLVAQKFMLNITHLGTILRSTLCRSKDTFDYRLPEPGGPAEFAPYRDNMAGRSLAAYMAFQEQAQMVVNPHAYVNKDRPPSPFDAIMIPPES